MNAQILCRPRPGTTLTFPIRQEDALIGRDPGIAVSLPMEGVSRAHAKITWDGKTHWIEDLKSTNGTFLNGQPIARERLRHLDVITLGKKADLLFVIRGGEVPLVKKRGIARATFTRDLPEALALPYEIGVGEITIGRSAACNVVAESSAVSKLHARIRRTAEELILEDLGSSNGTFVNGERVTTTLLHNVDLVLLGGVEGYRVGIAMGEVFSSGAYPKQDLAARPAGGERPNFSPEWKTRYQWDSIEGLQFDEVRRRVEEDQKVKAAAAAAKAPPKKTKEPPKPPAPAAGAAPPKPPAPAAPKPPVAAPPKPAPAASPAPISELRLTGGGFDLVASEPGEYDLGRAPDARLRVNHKTVSRRHARIVIAPDRLAVTVQDVGGANGTMLNGVLVEKPSPLKEGDRISLGEVTLEVRLKTA